MLHLQLDWIDESGGRMGAQMMPYVYLSEKAHERNMRAKHANGRGASKGRDKLARLQVVNTKHMAVEAVQFFRQ